MIEVKDSIFHLKGKDVSYIMMLSPSGQLVHIYFGKKLRNVKGIIPDCINNAEKWSVSNCYDMHNKNIFEYPSYGYSDLRHPAFEVKNAFENTVSNIVYKTHTVVKGVCEVPQMPSLNDRDANVETLIITMVDETVDLTVNLYYTVYEEYNIVARHCEFVNTSKAPQTIDSAYSSCFGLSGEREYRAIYFSGEWAKEREMVETNLNQGISLDLACAYGTSSHQLNPFVMIAEQNATEDMGIVYSMSLIYSGNHSTYISRDFYGDLRLMQGINPFQFEWTLDIGEHFYTPQSVICYSDNGIGGISRELSDLYRNNLMRSKYVFKERPILVNTWEAAFFDFDEPMLIESAHKAKELGIELFVLDDGWFGKRNTDTCSLGDWTVNYDKLPSGIEGLAKKINDIGLSFGLWFEPEMVNPDSDLYRKHPDWAIKIPNRETAQKRHQYVLDLSNSDVCDYIIKSVCDILNSANIAYVKWDMNRPLLNVPSMGYMHRYVLGYYKIMSTITEAFPDVLFEGCASGGGRFDAGVLTYMPQIWTSDNTDAFDRLYIQYSTSMGYPISAMGAHVTESPKRRNTPLKMRGDVALAGAFGYEFDIRKLSEETVLEVKAQIEREKKLRHLILTGDFYRLSSPYDSEFCIWELCAKDKSEAIVVCCKLHADAINKNNKKIFLKGLEKSADYVDMDSRNVFGGDTLMYAGLDVEYEPIDFATVVYHLVRK